MPQIAQGEAKIDTENQYLINHSEDIACYLSGWWLSHLNACHLASSSQLGHFYAGFKPLKLGGLVIY